LFQFPSWCSGQFPLKLVVKHLKKQDRIFLFLLTCKQRFFKQQRSEFAAKCTSCASSSASYHTQSCFFKRLSYNSWWLGRYHPKIVKILDDMAYSPGRNPEPLSSNVLSIEGGLSKDVFLCNIWNMVLVSHEHAVDRGMKQNQW